MTSVLPSLLGVIHLPPLPGSPRSTGDLGPAEERAFREAELLVAAGYDGIVIENFGDAPFFPGPVPPITIACMTTCARAAREGSKGLFLGVNILRNDADAALAVAVATHADMIRVNVHTGARVTDQGLVQGAAHQTLRTRRALAADRVRIFCDVDVKHSAPLAPRPIEEEAHDLAERGLADALLVTGSGTGRAASEADLDTVLRAVSVPVYVASGVTIDNLAAVRKAHGIIVGSALRAGGRAGAPIDHDLAARFAEAFRASRR
ncbi:BtpA/SgcQ family protein [Polyangium sorediatum]|uniref:BtpA/SgcQ family protein n=1 Tax=Polyangium sorediatum TaxID=889274 RepID=A0ABT6NU11_9BACT|nr:BtpA/SgcQ family protein [Polyangium sorediatum]MDI1431831.1 BtpA/SgcQ family protein [Polyangium sorediatum]